MAGYYLVVKCQHQDNSVALYALDSYLAEDGRLKHFGGEVAKRLTNTKLFIYKIDVKASEVISFSCSRNAIHLVFAGEKSSTTSMIPGKPNEEGVVHFYK